MKPEDQIPDQEKKLKNLEHELNDLRQGLTIVADYYRDLSQTSKEKAAVEELDETIVKPLVKDDLEFESIWKFRENVLVADPGFRVPCTAMFEAFVRYCAKNGRSAVGQDAFEFVFAHMKNPPPVLDSGDWVGFRLRADRL
jgi:hypothetical protein